MALTPEQVEELVVAVLAVNQYPVEKVWSQLPGLRSQGITNPAWVATADLGDVVAHLTASGHARGMLAGMMADRLQTLMRAIQSGAFDQLVPALKAGDREAAKRILLSVKGIGPKVAQTALMLLQ